VRGVRAAAHLQGSLSSALATARSTRQRRVTASIRPAALPTRQWPQHAVHVRAGPPAPPPPPVPAPPPWAIPWGYALAPAARPSGLPSPRTAIAARVARGGLATGALRWTEAPVLPGTAGAADPGAPLGRASHRLLVAYDGTEYSGWQLQQSARTVQGELERALSTVLREGREVLCVGGAGRTDAGVHAQGQVSLRLPT